MADATWMSLSSWNSNGTSEAGAGHWSGVRCRTIPIFVDLRLELRVGLGDAPGESMSGTSDARPARNLAKVARGDRWAGRVAGNRSSEAPELLARAWISELGVVQAFICR